MQIRQAELLGVIDDNGVGIRNVDTAFDDTCRYQYVVFVVHEVENLLFQFFRFHLSVCYTDTGIGNFPFHQGFYLVDILNTVVDEENLSVTTHLEVDGFADDVRIEAFYFRLYRITVGRRCRNATQISSSHQRELKGSRNRSGCHCQGIYVCLELS